MKKSNKKVPKTHLPKYRWGTKTTTLSNGNEESMYDAGPEGNSATSNLYNDKRSQGKGLGKTSNYVAAAAGTLGNYAAVANNPNLNSAQRTTAYGQSANQTADAVIGAVPVYGQAYGLVSGAKDMLLDSTTSSNINPETGEKSYKKGTDAAAGALLTPTHTSQINDWTKLANGDRSAETIAGSILPIGSLIGGVKAFTKGDDKYSENEKLIAAENQKQQDLANQQQAAYQQQQNDYINNAIQAGMANYQQPKGVSIQYAMGGMNMQPNSEVEGDEMITSNTPPQLKSGGNIKLASNNPYGTPTYKTEGLTHEQGGMPMNMAPGSIVNGKTRNPLTGNKFTKDIDIIAKQENKFTKKAESGDRYSNTNAKLILPILAQKKDYFNNLQNAIIANREQAKALKRGELPQAQHQIPDGNRMGGSMMRMGGLQKYDGGGPVDTLGTKVNTPPTNYKFNRQVDDKQVYVDPGNMKQAPATKTKSDPDAWNKYLTSQLQGGISPEELIGKGYATKEGLEPLMGEYKPKYVYIEPFTDEKKTTTPTSAQPYAGTRNAAIALPKTTATQDWNDISFPDLNGQANNSVTRSFDNAGNEFTFDPKTYERKLTGKNLEYYRGINVRSDGQGSTQMPTSTTNIAPVITNEPVKRGLVNSGTSGGFRYGGKFLPKFSTGGESKDDQLGYVPRNQVDKMRMQQATLNNQNRQFSSSAWSPEELQASSDALVEEGYNNTPITNSTPVATINQAKAYPIRRDKNGKLIFDTPSTKTTNSNYNQEAYDAELARMNAAGGRGKKEINWKNTLGQVGNFAAQNAGNIYDLLSRKKNEVEKYDRLKPTYLDPAASLRDAQMQANRAEYNVIGKSGGNSGTVLSNLIALNAQNTINKDRIRKEYANINAGISNQIGQYNNELSRAEVIANAQNRAVNDNIRRQAIGSLGSNFGQASLANKKGEMDQSMMDMLPKMINDPAFKKYYEEWAKKNG